MVAYSFKKQFSPYILNGSKAQTIRAERKRHARPEETLQLYTGMRTKHCRLIGTATCRRVEPITIDFPLNTVLIGKAVLMGWRDLDGLAHRDGFDGWLSMRAFWHDNHPAASVFSGVLIRWTDFRSGGGSGEIL